ncbi:insulin receptor substrate 1 [Anastrepha obliqua]|uniref:insulin receptor substrate 1 n=1 Tax=Anastrepha obliqua TaxID=95512 RepID=UPI00240A24FF|nr:insulin receptor substrate 1 [Anastrepha obliqua]
MSKPIDVNSDDGVVLSGYQKKLNTMKKKFFVLYKDTSRGCARLEYFDSMKKFKSGTSPKRVVKLENCFNINRRLDTKYDYVIALATKDGGFGIVLETENEMLNWLQTLLSLQRSITNKEDSYPLNFDHVWQVVVQKKNLAEERRIIGNYHVCLSPKSVTFIRIGPERASSGFLRATDIQILLNSIRRCGDSHCLFYMEVGRKCTIGPGELWMETEDPLVAQSMHKMISSAMSVRSTVNEGSMRKRSSSVTETSKPISFMDIGSMRPENKNYNINQSANNNLGRGRCDSFPTRSRESSDRLNQTFKSSHILNIPNCSMPMTPRPLPLPQHSTSPPLASPYICTERKESIKLDDQEDTGSYLPFRFKSAERAIPEENSEDLMISDSISFQKEAYISMAPVVKLLDSTENNNAQQAKPITLDDAAFLPSVNIKNCVGTSDLASQTHSIIISTAQPSDLEKEERPKRSYSIGSKIDKNKVKRLGNSNEILHDTNAVRVRAFSVGSRAKIPKCDLQRAVLFPRSRFNQSCISNNSLNFGTDEAGYKSDLNTNCDKKSTSAPILIQNGQVPMDCMSDLMEIDFSKSSSHKTHGKAVPERDTNSCLNDSASKSEFDYTRPFSSKITDHGESGYLEMKPVDCLINKPTSPVSNECFVKIPKTNDSLTATNVKIKEVKNAAQGKYIPVENVLKKQKDPLCLRPKELDHTFNEGNCANQITTHLEEPDYLQCENIAYLSSIYSNLSMQTSSNSSAEEKLSFSILDAEKSIKPSKKSQICNKEYNLKNTLSESLPVKSEESTEAVSSSDKEQKLPSPGISEKCPVFSNASSLSSDPVPSRCKSLANTRFNEPQTLTSFGNRANESLLGNCKAQQTNTPIASSVCSSYELYYAKLDLPQSSTKENINFHKTEADLSTIINTVNNSYAKIDFEHSSDSSSSSKTLNN